MSKEFLSFKRKMRLGAILRSLAFGLGLGVLVAASLLLLSKLEFLSRSSSFCWLTGAAVALVATGACLVLTLPTDKKLARRIDQMLSLGEKVQTMVEFQGNGGSMVLIQKNDTEEILRNTPYKRIRGKHLWLHGILPILACAAMVATLLIPTDAFDAPDVLVDPAYSMTAWQEQALKDLIRQVETSDMETVPKERIVAELGRLLAKVKSTNKESEMKAEVISTIRSIDKAMDGYDTYRTVSERLTESSREDVQEIGRYIGTMNAGALNESLKQLAQTLPDPAAISAFAAALDESTNGMQVGANDGFFVTLETFRKSLEQAAAIEDGEARAQAVEEAASDASLALNVTLLCQYANRRVKNTTVNRLMEIFGISESELPEGLLPDKEASGDYDSSFDDGEDDDKNNTGGIGSGDMIYASNDTIYYPDDNVYTEYGNVINEYYAKVAEKIVDGNISDEMKEILSDYFAILFDGSGNKEN